MKKNILHIFISTILAGALLASCSVLETVEKQSVVKVSGSISIASSRAAIPTIQGGANDTYTYYVTASDNFGNTINGEVDQTDLTYEIKIPRARDWKFEAGMEKTSSGTTSKILKSIVQLSKEQIDEDTYSLNFVLSPVVTENGTGNVELTVILPDENHMLKVHCEDTVLSQSWGADEVLSPSGSGNNDVTISKTGIKSATYNVKLILLDSNSKTVISMHQTITVVDGLTTNKWVGGNGNLDPITSSGVFEINEDFIAKFKQHVFYVGTINDTEGDDDNGEGSPYSPFASIEKAVQMMCDSSSDYKIYVSGTLSGAQIISGSISAKSITIEGLNGLGEDGKPKDKLTGGFNDENPGTTLSIGSETESTDGLSNVAITLKNIEISGGYAKGNGGGIMAGKGSKLTIAEGVLITGNRAAVNDGSGGFGGGVYICDVSTFEMKGGSITGNYAVDGAGIYTNGTMGAIFLNNTYFYGIVMSDGTISGNEASGKGGGIYIGGKDSFAIVGGSIAGNKATVAGSGVYVAEMPSGSTGEYSLFMGGSAKIESSNDVYLCDNTGNSYQPNKVIYLLSSLTEAAPVATITPATYSSTIYVLAKPSSGSVLKDIKSECGKFAITPQNVGGTEKQWGIAFSAALGLLSDCKVTFDTDGGSSVDYQYVAINGKATLPEPPTKTGYVFVTWFTDTNYTIAFDFSSGITADTTVYAKWISSSNDKTPENSNAKIEFSTSNNDEYFIRLEDYNYTASQWASAILIKNENAGSITNVYIDIVGENKSIGGNHGGFKVWGGGEGAGGTVNVYFFSSSQGSLEMGFQESGAHCMEWGNGAEVNYNILDNSSISSMTVGSDSYDTLEDFLTEAKGRSEVNDKATLTLEKK